MSGNFPMATSGRATNSALVRFYAIAAALVTASVLVLIAAVDATANSSSVRQKATPVTDCNSALSVANSSVLRMSKLKAAARTASTTARHRAALRRLASARKSWRTTTTALQDHCKPDIGVTSWWSSCNRATGHFRTWSDRRASARAALRHAGPAKKGRLRKHLKRVGKHVTSSHRAFVLACAGSSRAGSGASGVNHPFTDPSQKDSNGNLGLVCTVTDLLSVGCDSPDLTVTIPSFPNGLTGTYIADLTGYLHGLSSTGVLSQYTATITVDGTVVATASGTQVLPLVPIDLDLSKLNLSLSANQAHTVAVRLQTGSLLAVLPTVNDARLTVDLH